MCSPFLFISNLETLFLQPISVLALLKCNHQITPGVSCDLRVWFWLTLPVSL